MDLTLRLDFQQIVLAQRFQASRICLRNLKSELGDPGVYFFCAQGSLFATEAEMI